MVDGCHFPLVTFLSLFELFDHILLSYYLIYLSQTITIHIQYTCGIRAPDTLHFRNVGAQNTMQSYTNGLCRDLFISFRINEFNWNQDQWSRISLIGTKKKYNVHQNPSQEHPDYHPQLHPRLSSTCGFFSVWNSMWNAEIQNISHFVHCWDILIMTKTPVRNPQCPPQLQSLLWGGKGSLHL